jgi:predicted NBD/HSP70 family sugar kinase
VAGPTAVGDSATAAGDQRAVGQLIDVVGRAIISVAAVVDPELVLLGGPVGTHPALLPRVRDMIADAFPGPTRIDRGALGEHAPLHGALQMAVEHALATAVAVASTG